MHTQESYQSKWEPPFVFPWEQDYHERQMRKVQVESEKALKEVAERARQQAKLESAQMMLNKGLDASFIAEITGLEEKLILSLAQSTA